MAHCFFGLATKRWLRGSLTVVVLLGVWSWAVSEGLAQGTLAEERPAGEDAQSSRGQNAGPDASEVSGRGESEESEAGSSSNDSLGQVVLKTGTVGLIFFGVLGIFSLVMVTVACGRLLYLVRSRVMPPEFVARLRELVERQESDAEEFRRLCDSSEAPISQVLRGGLIRAGRPLPEVEKSMEDVAAREMATMRSRNRPLSVVGNVAPLVGLLGTVVGMIMAFRTASEAGLGKGELLAEGIYLALMTTAAGLTIAIPSMLFAAWFNGRAERLMREMDVHLLETLPCFARMEREGKTASEATSSPAT